MMTATKQAKAVETIIRKVRDGKYSPHDILMLEGAAERLAAWVGLTADGSDEVWLTPRQISRIERVAAQYDVDVPQSIADGIAERDAERAEARKDHRFRNRHGETLTIRANFAQAADSIRAKWDDGDWFCTPFQVADARHSASAACKLVAGWGR